MPVIRTEARQGHAVPRGYSRRIGPFPPEIFARNPREYESFNHPAPIHESLDDVRYFRCKECDDVLYENQLAEHVCEDE